jgi:hypothetical protein
MVSPIDIRVLKYYGWWKKAQVASKVLSENSSFLPYIYWFDDPRLEQYQHFPFFALTQHLSFSFCFKTE